MDAASIVSDARNSIGKFCYEECHAYCCRKGTLPVKIKELRLLSKEKRAGLLFYHEKLSVVLPCPSLVDSKCMIHSDEGRPKVCKEFPIFIKGKKIEVVGMCLAVRNGLLYPHMRQLKQLGYTIIEK